MKIAITGHSAGIGQALSTIYTEQGHEVVGLSRRNGYNIRSIPKLSSMIESCDMFINNAQVGFAQTELFWEVWNRWRGQNKTIINISTQMTNNSVAPKEEWDQYIIQKKALELAHTQCQERSPLPKLILIKPGSIATQPSQQPPEYQDVNEYAQKTIEYINGQ
jgi:nucleoside-diphosphate-sugar epimerase